MSKHTQFVHEVAKFFSGLVAADLLFGIWLGSSNSFGSALLGVPLTAPFINGWIIFDFLLLLLLIHYAWNIRLPLSPSRRAFFLTTGSILGIVAVLHFLRVIYSVPVMIGGLAIPFWFSVVGTIVVGFLSYASFHFAKK